MTATLNINTIRARAAALAKDFDGITSEKQHDQNFMRRFCEVFGISPRRITWQYPVKKGKSTLWIDGLLPGLLLMEMKSAGENLDDAYVQAAGYVASMAEKHIPSTVLISDFKRLRIHKRETGEIIEIALADLSRNIEPLLFLAGYEARAIEQEQAANEQAAEKMAGFYDAIKATGYEGKDLETYLVRLLFCLFADDTGLFGENGRFLDLLANHTKADGSDLHGVLSALFDTLNRAKDTRPKNLPEHFQGFPHVNGGLFKEVLAQCYFDESARNRLMECARFNWSQISPAIFGSLFQAIMHFDDEKAKTKKRREFGAHYTSETNILKAIEPLFLESLREEFGKVRHNRAQLGKFHKKLRTLNFFDPACGCGNFLVIAYRELRLLELEVIEILHGQDKNISDVALMVQVDVDQCHGIEIDGSATQIAKVALWLTDHQMNLKVQRLGAYKDRLPLVTEANIRCGNALRMDWAQVVAPGKCGFIMGNPPFVGKKEQTKPQKADLEPLFAGVKGAGVLDYVTAWYAKATEYIKSNPVIPVAFVSTNSICQGEQVGVLWPWLLSQGVKINFAHRTFQWSNEGKGVAAVHCVIIGFGLKDAAEKWIFDYETPKSEPTETKAKNINPYLVDALDIWVEKRMSPLCDAPEMDFGSKAADFGYLTLSEDERKELSKQHPDAEPWVREFIGSEEFINGTRRYCLWLKGISPKELKKYPWIMRRVEKCREARLKSVDANTRRWAEFPSLFQADRQPETDYLLVPKVSSERRKYIPLGFCSADLIVNPSVLVVPSATLFHFGVLQSIMHMAWISATAGRLESRYQYSNTVVYNNFPWPTPTEPQIETIEAKAQAVLDARAAHPDSTLADLYDPLAMPPDLTKAHAALDRAVDAAYGYKGGKHDAARVAFLFGLYRKLTAPVEPAREPEAFAEV